MTSLVLIYDTYLTFYRMSLALSPLHVVITTINAKVWVYTLVNVICTPHLPSYEMFHNNQSLHIIWPHAMLVIIF
jgi:hypothetical protein